MTTSSNEFDLAIVGAGICNNAKLCSSYNEPGIGKRVNESDLAESRTRMHKAAAAAE